MSGPANYTLYRSPLGDLLLIGSRGALSALHFDNAERLGALTRELTEQAGAFAAPIRQLDEYFAGERTEFELELAPRGTEFQMQVWQALREIPYGQTRSYGQIAQAIGRPKAARAVGSANNKNPLAVIVPCHRVVGSSGKMVGYAGGLDRKSWLLSHEAARSANSSS